MPGIQKALKLYYCCYIAKKLTLRHWSRRFLETGIVYVHMHGGQRSTTDVALICSQKCLFIEPRVHRLNQPVKPVSFRNLPFSSYSHNAVLELQMLAAVSVQLLCAYCEPELSSSCLQGKRFANFTVPRQSPLVRSYI